MTFETFSSEAKFLRGHKSKVSRFVHDLYFNVDRCGCNVILRPPGLASHSSGPCKDDDPPEFLMVTFETYF